jgi:FlaG/FlaF family flagellin (archaellin)
MKNFLACASLTVLVACSTGAGMPHAAVTFQHIQAMPVNVSNIETNVNEGQEVDGFVISPSDTAEKYLASRFNAVGSGGTLRASMEEVTVRHVYKGATGKVTGFLNVAGHDVYDVKLVLRLEHISASGTVLYGNTIKAQRTMSITEHASISEREKHQMEGLEKLFADLDRQVVSTVVTGMRISAQ